MKRFLASILSILLLCGLSSCSTQADSKEYFGFDKADFTVVEESDTHGGFLGDGSYFLILDCAANKEQASEDLEGWKPLPLSENLNLILYGGERDGVNYSYDLAEQAGFPKIENGYYYFEDRQDGSLDKSDDSQLFDRGSFNFSVALYDSDTDRMYYLSFDT